MPKLPHPKDSGKRAKRDRRIVALPESVDERTLWLPGLTPAVGRVSPEKEAATRPGRYPRPRPTAGAPGEPPSAERDVAGVDEELGLAADVAGVDEELGLAADVAGVDEELGLAADVAGVDEELGLAADVAAIHDIGAMSSPKMQRPPEQYREWLPGRRPPPEVRCERCGEVAPCVIEGRPEGDTAYASEHLRPPVTWPSWWSCPAHAGVTPGEATDYAEETTDGTATPHAARETPTIAPTVAATTPRRRSP